MISLLFNMLVKGNLKASLVTRPYSKPIRRLIEVVERDMTIYSAESYDVSYRTLTDFFQSTESHPEEHYVWKIVRKKPKKFAFTFGLFF